MKVELKPCPFCRCEIALEESTQKDPLMGPRRFYTPTGGHKGFGGYCPGESVRGSASIEAATDRWNERPGEQAAFNAGLERGAVIAERWPDRMEGAGIAEKIRKERNGHGTDGN